MNAIGIVWSRFGVEGSPVVNPLVPYSPLRERLAGTCCFCSLCLPHACLPSLLVNKYSLLEVVAVGPMPTAVRPKELVWPGVALSR